MSEEADVSRNIALCVTESSDRLKKMGELVSGFKCLEQRPPEAIIKFLTLTLFT